MESEMYTDLLLLLGAMAVVTYIIYQWLIKPWADDQEFRQQNPEFLGEAKYTLGFWMSFGYLPGPLWGIFSQTLDRLLQSFGIRLVLVDSVLGAQLCQNKELPDGIDQVEGCQLVAVTIAECRYSEVNGRLRLIVNLRTHRLPDGGVYSAWITNGRTNELDKVQPDARKLAEQMAREIKRSVKRIKDKESPDILPERFVSKYRAAAPTA